MHVLVVLATGTTALLAPDAAASAVLSVPSQYATIQAAIDAASDGDTIELAPGTYAEAIDMKGLLLVIEGTGGAAVTTLDASGADSAVTADGAEPDGALLRGLTLTGGIGRLVADSRPGAGGSVTGGGGVFVGEGAHLALEQCVVTGNVVSAAGAQQGGGVLVFRGTIDLTDCELAFNAANRGAAIAAYSFGCVIHMTRCDVTDNTAGSGSVSAAMDFFAASGTLEECLVADNVGHGIWSTNYALTLHDCTFVGNSGWGFRHYGPVGSTLADCTFLGNGAGGADLLQPGTFFSDHSVERCVFAGGDGLRANLGSCCSTNVLGCTFDGGGIEADDAMLFVEDSIVRNTATPFTGGFTSIQVDYSDVPAAWVAAGGLNIDADPLWANPGAGDYSLLPGSPCIDAGNPSSDDDPDGTTADMGAVPYFQQWIDLGYPLAGAGGTPTLAGTGSLVPGEPIALTLAGALPLAPSALILGFSEFVVLFKGGVIVPHPDLVFSLSTDAGGGVVLGAHWPAGAPAGVVTIYQHWIQDASGPAGYTASNALRATVP